MFKGARGVPAFKTDANGIVTVEVKPEDQIWVATNWWVTCRKIPPPAEVDYVPVESLLREGLVVQNTCGKAKSATFKGKLVIFARKRTLWEAFRD